LKIEKRPVERWGVFLEGLLDDDADTHRSDISEDGDCHTVTNRLRKKAIYVVSMNSNNNRRFAI
jgi:hypothetical protein